MPTQTINMNDVYNVKYNNQTVSRIILRKPLSETKIWEGGIQGRLVFFSIGQFSLSIIDAQQYWDGTIEVSTDGGTTWSTWDGTTTVTSGTGLSSIAVRGTGNTYITGSTASNTKGIWSFTHTDPAGIITIAGNIENLLDYNSVAQGIHPVMANYCFKNLFYNNTQLKVAINDGTPGSDYSEFKLPSKTLSKYCYSQMFVGCTALTSAPALPATTLSERCYNNMFYGCTSLITAPALPATTLSNYCYYGMFQGCTSLTSTPALSATTLSNYCYSNMFFGCTALTSAPALPATTLANGCYSNMFYGCTSLITAPALPATTLSKYCYSNMFNGCTNIKLSSTQTGDYINAYRIPTSGTGTTDTTNWNTNMFANTGGTFTSNPTINTTYYTSNTIVS